MNIIPAIDLLDGKCVRLQRGERERATVYAKEPLAVAQDYCSAGARLIHVVDLDGAFTGQMKNMPIIRELARRFPIQVGGGVRCEVRVRELLAAGVKKVVVSSLLYQNTGTANSIKEKYYGRLVGALDMKNRRLAYSGWKKTSAMRFEDAAEGLAEVMVTDVARDGMLSGPNFDLLRDLRTRFSGKLITSGGVRGADDIARLEKIGIDGAIVGKAILEGRLDLKQVIRITEYW